MGKIEIQVNMTAFESKLKIFNKHLGNMLDDLEKVCAECGSFNTETVHAYADGDVYTTVKKCKDCESSELIK